MRVEQGDLLLPRQTDDAEHDPHDRRVGVSRRQAQFAKRRPRRLFDQEREQIGGDVAAEGARLDALPPPDPSWKAL